MTLILHIGTHKTGTTTIQRFAASHRKELRRRGLRYPSYKSIGLPGHYAHHHFAHAIADEKGNALSLEDAERFAKFIRGRWWQRGKTLLSAEPLYRHVLSSEADYWRAREAYVAKVRRVLGREKITVLAVLRRQDRFAESLYQEKVKSRAYSKTFREFLVEQRHEFEYFRQLSIFAEAFGRVEVLIYEDLQQEGLIDGFFGHLGVDVSGLARPSARNVSLPLELVEYKRLLNTSKIAKKRLAKVVEKLESRAQRGELQNDFGWIARTEMEDFCRSFDDDNERLRQSFAADRSSPLFPSLEAVPIAEKTAYHGMSTQRFADLTTEILW